MRVFQPPSKPFREAFIVQALAISQCARELSGSCVDDRHSSDLSPAQDVRANRDLLRGYMLMYPKVKALVPTTQYGDRPVISGQLNRKRIIKLPTRRS
jgi:hypothetical protein